MRVKGIMQNDINDCGIACLATICAYFNYKVPLIKIRELMRCNEDGISILDICEAAKKLNFDTEVLYGTWTELYKEVLENQKLPIIVHSKTDKGYGHYIVVWKYSRIKIYVFDPADGHKTYSEKEFCDIWSGYLIILIPNENFYEYKCTSHYKKYIDIIWENKKNIWLSIFISTVIIGIEIMGAMMYQTVIDKHVLGNRDTSFLSAGERQRLIIARGLLRKPEVMVFDEITSNLDENSEKKLWYKLLKKYSDATFIIATHRMEVAKYADRVCILKDGKIISDVCSQNFIREGIKV